MNCVNIFMVLLYMTGLHKLIFYKFARHGSISIWHNLPEAQGLHSLLLVSEKKKLSFLPHYVSLDLMYIFSFNVACLLSKLLVF